MTAHALMTWLSCTVHVPDDKTEQNEVDDTDNLEKTFTVKFYLSDNVEKDPDVVQRVNAGEKAIKPKPDPVKEDFDFVGWFIDDENEYNFDTPVTDPGHFVRDAMV